MQPENFIFQPRGRATIQPAFSPLRGWQFTFAGDLDEIVLPLPADTFDHVKVTLKFKFSPVSQELGTLVAGIRTRDKTVLLEPMQLNVNAHELSAYTVEHAGGEHVEVFFRRGSTNSVAVSWFAVEGGQKEIATEPVTRAKKAA